MKLESIKLKALVLFFAALALPMTFAACGGDDDEDGDDKDKTEQGGGNGGNTDTDKNARALAVTIDESGLTYEDYTIEQSGEVLIEFKNVPFGKVKVTLEDLPTSVAELKKLKLPNGMKDIHETPYLTPALMVAAINQLTKNRDEAKNMIDYISKEVKSENRDGKMVHYPGKGATQIYVSDWNQLKQWVNFDKVRSFFEDTSYYNGYTKKPWVMTMELTNYSYTADPDYVQLWLTSTSLKDSKGNPTPREYGIWKYDSNGDGEYDYFFGSTMLQLCSGLATYSTDY